MPQGGERSGRIVGRAIEPGSRSASRRIGYLSLAFGGGTRESGSKKTPMHSGSLHRGLGTPEQPGGKPSAGGRQGFAIAGPGDHSRPCRETVQAGQTRRSRRSRRGEQQRSTVAGRGGSNTVFASGSVAAAGDGLGSSAQATATRPRPSLDVCSRELSNSGVAPRGRAPKATSPQRTTAAAQLGTLPTV